MPHNPVPDVLAVHRNYYQIVSVNTTLGVGFFGIGVGFLHRGITVSSLSLVAGEATTRELMSQLPAILFFIFFVYSCQTGHPCSGRTAAGWGSQAAWSFINYLCTSG